MLWHFECSSLPGARILSKGASSYCTAYTGGGDPVGFQPRGSLGPTCHGVIRIFSIESTSCDEKRESVA